MYVLDDVVFLLNSLPPCVFSSNFYNKFTNPCLSPSIWDPIIGITGSNRDYPVLWVQNLSLFVSLLLHVNSLILFPFIFTDSTRLLYHKMILMKSRYVNRTTVLLCREETPVKPKRRFFMIRWELRYQSERNTLYKRSICIQIWCNRVDLVFEYISIFLLLYPLFLSMKIIKDVSVICMEVYKEDKVADT